MYKDDKFWHNFSSDPFNYLEDGRKEIKGGRRETKGRRGAESERTGYGKREVMIHLFVHLRMPK